MNKKGSYIVEASIVLPILIICISSLIMVIRIISVCENITFVTAKSLIESVFGYYDKFNEISLCMEIENSINDVSNFQITQYRYLYQDGSDDGLITLDAKAEFNVNNAIGVKGKISFTEKVLCRGFVGASRNGNPLSEADFADYKEACTVYVFPRYGERFHRSDCRYVKQNMGKEAYIVYMDREDAYRKGFTPCIICKGAAYE